MTATARAFARAALLGNPSDGYGGRTIAVTIAEYAAEVELDPASATTVDPPLAAPLVRAAIARFPLRSEGGYAVRWRSTIPREVGLAGSSAIVIATLRALGALHRAPLDADALAREALAAEVEELGIAAGPQDRVVQARQGLVSMDFGAGAGHEALDPALLPPLFLAHRTGGGAPSHGVHGDLRERWERGERAVREAMAELARLAAAGRDALLRGDSAAFGALIDANFEVRRRILSLDDADVAMVARAREVGASAHLAGSGGAIVGSLGPASLADVQRALGPLGCAVIVPRIAPADAMALSSRA